MSPEEKIQYVKDNIDGETLISPKGPIRYHVTSVGHPDNPEEWTALTRNEHRRILQKLEQEQYIKNLTLVGNGDYYMLEKVDSFSNEKVAVDFTQKGKTSTDYLMEAVNFFKNEYNKIRIKGVTYEYPMGDNLTLSNYDPAPDEVNLPFYRRIAIERLHEIGLVTSYEFEERVIDDYGSVFDYAHCKINEDMLIEPQENPKVTQENAEKLVEKVIRHEHNHRFENSIQEKPIDLNINSTSPDKTTKVGFPYTIPDGTRWENIMLTFLNDEYVKINVAGNSLETGFADMGFADGRKKGVCNELWILLRLLAKQGGSLPASDPEAKDKYKQQKARLSTALKNYFRLDTDPFKPYTKEKAYTLKMTIGYTDKNTEPTKAETLASEADDIFKSFSQ